MRLKHRIKDFRTKPPFIGKCKDCKCKVLVKSVHLPQCKSGLQMVQLNTMFSRVGGFVRKWKKETTDLCEKCLKRLPGRNCYKVAELSEAEIEKKREEFGRILEEQKTIVAPSVPMTRYRHRGSIHRHKEPS